MDVAKVVSEYLRTDAGVTAIGAERVWTLLPTNKVYPLLLVRRAGGSYRDDIGWQQGAIVQLWALADRRADAQALAQAALDAMTVANQATHDGAVVTGVDLGTIRDEPDSEMNEGKPRPGVSAFVTVYVHPAP
ncbi:MAG: DUF3168 domain-containing protein [Actinomycetota bacterium]